MSGGGARPAQACRCRRSRRRDEGAGFRCSRSLHGGIASSKCTAASPSHNLSSLHTRVERISLPLPVRGDTLCVTHPPVCQCRSPPNTEQKSLLREAYEESGLLADVAERAMRYLSEIDERSGVRRATRSRRCARSTFRSRSPISPADVMTLTVPRPRRRSPDRDSSVSSAGRDYPRPLPPIGCRRRGRSTGHSGCYHQQRRGSSRSRFAGRSSCSGFQRRARARSSPGRRWRTSPGSPLRGRRSLGRWDGTSRPTGCSAHRRSR